MRWDPAGGTDPSYAELMAEADPQGNQRSYLASDETFQVFRRYQLRNRIVPLVGDFGGTRTLPAVGRIWRATVRSWPRSIRRTSRYISATRWTDSSTNVKALPRDEHSMFIRTRFNAVGFTRGREHYKTTTIIESIQDTLDWRRTPGAQ